MITDQFCCIRLHFRYVCYPICQFLTRKGVDKKKKMARGVGGRLFQGGNYFKFHQRGAIILREEINQEMAIIGGSTCNLV